MRLPAVGVLIAIVAHAAVGHAADSPSLKSATRAVRELRYPDARAELEALVKQGGHPRERFLSILQLEAEVVSIMDGAEAGEREFRRLLVLDPTRTPSRRTPVLMMPFERARKWVAVNGALKAVATPAQAEAPLELEVRLANDPLAMASSVRVQVQSAEGKPYVAIPGRGLRATLPAEAAEHEVAYYLEVLDASENVLATIGSAEDPQLSTPSESQPAPPKNGGSTETPSAPRAVPAHPLPSVSTSPSLRQRHPLLVAGLGVGGVSLGLLGAAIGVDVTAGAEYNALTHRCAPKCTSADLQTLSLERGLAATFYALAAGGLVTTLVLVIVDRVRAAHHH